MFSNNIDQLLHLLDLERLDRDLFRGLSPQGRRDRIFGGQVLAQALIAAGRTVDARPAHSLHGYFLRPGDPHIPILYEVDRIRDGRSFTTRRVRAIQNGAAISNLSISYHTPEDGGIEHEIDGDVPDEVDGQLYEEAIREEFAHFGMALEDDDRKYDLPIEVRTREGLSFSDLSIKPPTLHSWMRTKGPLPDEPALHQATLAYASDLTVLLAALHPHPVNVTTPGFRTASLDHALWFHRPFRFDEWLFFDQEAPVVACGRGFGRGTFHARDGRLVASCAQEGLIRYRPPTPERD